jgi:DNA topoisomerase-2
MAPKVKSIEEIYQKKDLHQHILDRPDSYIGSNKIVSEEQYVAVESADNTVIVKKPIEYNPALIKIFDEILVNAIDHTVRDHTATFIKVNIDTKDNSITVINNGAGIPVVKHKEHQVYIPEMIFGQLLTSSNYDDNENRIVGGRNGLGSKLTCVYSKFFSVETVDSERELFYYQEFKNNMFDKSEPQIKKSKVKSYTKIKFIPDLKIFKFKTLTPDTIALLKKRVYDCIACTNKNVSVYLNETKLKQKDFPQYIALYQGSPAVYEKFEENGFVWEYSVHMNDNYEQISFVNGICTTQGGKHVEYILNQIIKKLLDMIQAKKKIDNLKSSYIKDKLCIYLKSTVVNPAFSSQTKEYLSTSFKDFGCKVEVSDQFITKLYKNSGIVDEIISFTKYKNERELNKTCAATKKQSKLIIPKLDDAYNAGTSKSKNCTLILTEGDSAKTFAESGVSVIGRENYGIFPIRGKLLNVKEATQKQLLENEEINNLKKIIGLQHSKKYTNTDTLRYSKICILTDQDYDGSHIKGLLMNMFHTWWPELLEIPGFLICIKTPIVKVTKGTKQEVFYTIKDFKDWEKNTTNSKNWAVKYYKGLGTSTSKDAKEIFKMMNKLIIRYFSSNIHETNQALQLAFEKKKADDRKEWLQNYNFNMTLDQADSDISYKDFIYRDLIHFSMYDVIRSIPCICDGLKPSQRKVLYTMFKKKYTKEIKVVQLGGAVAETTIYHHGEASLYGTIINMAQDFIGSNNINLLKPNGQFGSRLTSNGKDAASPRYIFTELNEITKKIFNSDDFNILKNQHEDNIEIEPVYFMPLLPLVLINGTQGIGTGYSTNIPCFNPKDIVENLKRLIAGEELKDLVPWYRGFKGTIVEEYSGNFRMNGIYTLDKNKNTLHITEIPVGEGITHYKEFLEGLVKDSTYNVKDFINNSTEVHPDFLIKFSDISSLEGQNILKIFKLTKSISTTNFHLLNEEGTITKYNDAEEILRYFYRIRLYYNTKRKEYLTNLYTEELISLNNKIRFLKAIMDSTLVVYKKSKAELDKMLTKENYEKINDSYNYLISMPIYSFTKEKLDDLYNKHSDIESKLKTIKTKTNKQMLADDLENLTEL